MKTSSTELSTSAGMKKSKMPASERSLSTLRPTALSTGWTAAAFENLPRTIRLIRIRTLNVFPHYSSPPSRERMKETTCLVHVEGRVSSAIMKNTNGTSCLNNQEIGICSIMTDVSFLQRSPSDSIGISVNLRIGDVAVGIFLR